MHLYSRLQNATSREHSKITEAFNPVAYFYYVGVITLLMQVIQGRGREILRHLSDQRNYRGLKDLHLCQKLPSKELKQ